MRGTYDDLVQRVLYEGRARIPSAHLYLEVVKRLDPTGLPPGTPSGLLRFVGDMRYDYGKHEEGAELELTTSFEWTPLVREGAGFRALTDRKDRKGRVVTTASREGVFPWNLKNECFDAAASDIAGAILLAARAASEDDERFYGDLSPSPENAWLLVVEGNAWAATPHRDYERPREFKPELGNTRCAA